VASEFFERMRFSRSQGGNRRPNRRGWPRVIRVLGEYLGHSPLLHAGGNPVLVGQGAHQLISMARQTEIYSGPCMNMAFVEIYFCRFGVSSSAANDGRSRTPKLYAHAGLCSGIQVTASSHSAWGCLASRDCEANLVKA
jgi:hypothetical protein